MAPRAKYKSEPVAERGRITAHAHDPPPPHERHPRVPFALVSCARARLRARAGAVELDSSSAERGTPGLVGAARRQLSKFQVARTTPRRPGGPCSAYTPPCQPQRRATFTRRFDHSFPNCPQRVVLDLLTASRRRHRPAKPASTAATSTTTKLAPAYA